MKRIVFTVTNDLCYDQRMIRISSSLAAAGYQVTLVGRKKKNSLPLQSQIFHQKRLGCFFEKGFFFYAEYNIRLFFYLLFIRTDIIGAIDLDSILPCYFVSVLKQTERVYDAHELFCEMQEIVSRPRIYTIWKAIEKFAVPKFSIGYTVNTPIADEFRKLYGVQYEVIRNLPVHYSLSHADKSDKFILYQGAVNEGRSFETLIPAMQWVTAPLVICGDGNFMDQAKALVIQYNLQDKVIFKGMLLPEELKSINSKAWIGVTLFSPDGMSNYFSLANRFFDYIQAGIPQLCVDYPVYQEINNLYRIAVLTKDLDPKSLAHHLNELLQNESLYQILRQNCLKARTIYNWQEEEKRLVSFYNTKFA